MAGYSDSPGCSRDSPVSDEHAGDHGESNKNSNNDLSSVREQDRFLPIANISRIMKRALPANAKIAKEAKDIIQECVSEFVSFITSEASDKCQREKRKTINGDDLLWALGTLGFEDYVEPLKIYLAKFRELEGDGKGTIPTSKNGIEALTRKEASGSSGLSNAQVGQPAGYHTTMGYCQAQTQQPLATTHGNWAL